MNNAYTDIGFEDAFIEVPTVSTCSQLKGDVRFFHLNIRNNRFVLEEMAEYLKYNLSRYFHSRAERMEFGERIDSAVMKRIWKGRFSMFL
mgnify:CR=1 FL=1